MTLPVCCSAVYCLIPPLPSALFFGGGDSILWAHLRSMTCCCIGCSNCASESPGFDTQQQQRLLPGGKRPDRLWGRQSPLQWLSRLLGGDKSAGAWYIPPFVDKLKKEDLCPTYDAFYSWTSGYLRFGRSCSFCRGKGVPEVFSGTDVSRDCCASCPRRRESLETTMWKHQTSQG